MLPILSTNVCTTLLPTHTNTQETVLFFDAISCIFGTRYTTSAPLPKNIYLLVDNSYSMHCSKAKVVTLIREYFSFLSDEAASFSLRHKFSGSLFDDQSKAVPSDGVFMDNFLSMFDVNGYGTLLAPGLSRVIEEWLTKINPCDAYENILILITDGINSDSKDVKKMRELFLSLLKTRSVALYIFGFESMETAKSTLDNFTDFNDENATGGCVDSTVKIHYSFIDSLESIPTALRILTSHRTILRDSVVTLYNSNPLINVRLVGFPSCQDPFPQRYPECAKKTFFWGSPQVSDFRSLVISILGCWSLNDSIAICIDGIDPATGNPFSSGPIQNPLPLQPEIHKEVFFAVLPQLAQEARKAQDRCRQREILYMIQFMRQQLGDHFLLLENQKYLEKALQTSPATEVDDLLDALHSLSIRN
ncbi:MAG: hypothetical protein ACE5GN_05290 [Waddliaceae bacterium]